MNPEPRHIVHRRARARIRAIGLVMAMLLGAIAVRGVQLCVDPSIRTVRASSVQRWGKVTLRAPRGDVLDRHGRRLATTVDTPTVVVDPYLVDEEEVVSLSIQVADILDVDPVWVAERMRRDSRYARLATRVHPALADRVEKLRHPALWVHRDPRRYYPEEGLAAQLVGFVDASGSGREGLESALDGKLRGGTLLFERRRDRYGRGVDGPLLLPDAAGMDVQLTIDLSIQRIAEQALASIVETSAPKSASAVVVDVRTGDILALANTPGFDPNHPGDDGAPRRNHVVEDAIEPGSTFKPFVLAAALEEGLIDEETKVDCEGGSWAIGRSRIRDDHPHGVVSATEVLKYSSNIGTAKQAFRMGASTTIGYLKAFGFGERTGIPLPGERAGRIRDPQTIKPIELATTAFGQGITVTPLQMAMGVGAIANGGVLMQPRLVMEIRDPQGLPEYQQKPTEVRRVVSEQTAAATTRMMVAVMEKGGTGTRARVPGYQVAGKTGTAQKVEDGRYSDARIGSFVGFIPADRPVLAIVVVVDEPTIGSRYGGIVAAPAWGEIAGRSLRHLGVAPDPVDPAVAAASPRDPEPEPIAPTTLTFADGGWRLPDLTGRSTREILASLPGAGLDVHLEGSGRVASQLPVPGSLVPVGGTVSLVLR